MIFQLQRKVLTIATSTWVLGLFCSSLRSLDVRCTNPRWWKTGVGVWLWTRTLFTTCAWEGEGLTMNTDPFHDFHDLCMLGRWCYQLYFYRPMNTLWVIWPTWRRSPSLPCDIYNSTNFRLGRPESPGQLCFLQSALPRYWTHDEVVTPADRQSGIPGTGGGVYTTYFAIFMKRRSQCRETHPARLSQKNTP